jgi:hypothetical protein
MYETSCEAPREDTFLRFQVSESSTAGRQHIATSPFIYSHISTLL